ncbi:MAG: sugar phosphate nucleotidyltransferase, partial [Planctomycetaceae bacterium]|nr:sugar phosphate nucleotidyltransferase [Planctomycetaceae bacterium]
QAFREKPDVAAAMNYLAAGNYFWNCGIFVWKARTILAALAEFQPEIHVRLQHLSRFIDTPQWSAHLAAEFPAMTSISIDYAVLERSTAVCMLPAPFSWDDVGSWQALSRLIPDDAAGNTVDGLHVGVETEHCTVRSSSEHLIATIGVHDLIIVHTPDVTLVADRRDETAIKTLLAEVQRRGLQAYL